MAGEHRRGSGKVSRTSSGRGGRLPGLLVVLAGVLTVTSLLPGALAGGVGAADAGAASEHGLAGAIDRVDDQTTIDAATTDQARANLDAAGDLLATLDEDTDGTAAIDLAVRSLEHRADALGIDLPDEVPGPSYEQPSRAVFELADRQGVAVGASQADAIDRLDRLDEPRRDALTGVLNAFLAVQAATDEAYVHASLDEIPLDAPVTGEIQASTAGPSGNPQALAPGGTGVNLAPVLASHQNLLAAAGQLHAVWNKPVPALVPGPANGATNGLTLDLCPAVALDLSGSNSVYSSDCALIVDVGGNDVYENNAGGAVESAAALVDLGDGNDAYRGTGDGVHGGAVSGSGFLFDAAGNDDYNATDNGTQQGVNGGGHLAGVGTLVNLDGNDDYHAEAGLNQLAANGGGSRGGVGSLVDVSGNDAYTVAEGVNQVAVNGGGSTGGMGWLVDASGNDVYSSIAEAGQAGVNGGGTAGGVGSLMDAAGDDIYTVAGSGVQQAANGGGQLGGVGSVLDASGNDIYNATVDGFQQGVNGGAHGAGVGSVADFAGDDTYVATANGGQDGVNGGGATGGMGSVVDLAGDDEYVATATLGQTGANGGADLAFGLLADADGVDRFQDDDGTCDNATTSDCSQIPKGTVGALVDG